jgi:prepilin peptidase CpaA
MPLSEYREAIAMAVALVAVVFDLRTRRIPNYLTIGTAAVALAVSGFAEGTTGLAGAGLGWLVGAIVFFPFFALGGMGAGDVKLMAALGALLGPINAIWLAIFSSIAGGVVAVLVSMSRGYLQQALANVWLMLLHWRVAGAGAVPGMTLRDTRGPRLAYAIPIAIGVVCTIWTR